MVFVTVCQVSPAQLRLARSFHWMVPGLMSFEGAESMVGQG